MYWGRIVAVAALWLVACGGEGGTADTPRAGELACSRSLPSACGLEVQECARRVDENIVRCARTMLRVADVAQPTREQAENAAMLGLLCADHVLYAQRRQEGYECTGELPQGEVYEACPVCVVEYQSSAP